MNTPRDERMALFDADGKRITRWYPVGKPFLGTAEAANKTSAWVGVLDFARQDVGEPTRFALSMTVVQGTEHTILLPHPDRAIV